MGVNVKSKKPEKRKSAKKRRKEKERTKNSAAVSVGHRIKRLLQVFFVLVLLAVVIGAAWFYIAYGKVLLGYQSKANALVRKSKAETFQASQTSLVYASNGELISTLKGEKDVYYLTFENIPDYAVQAMICTEDRKFYEHGGFDLFANIRAAIALIKNKGEIHQGGSTITQQLARNIFLSNDVTWERKITEIFVAMALERKYTKSQILEFYLNNIYFANGHYGIQAASMGYFGKGVKELSLSQIAFLCAIPNNPTDYNPLRNFDNTLARRNKVLEQMREQGAISVVEYNNAVKEKISLNLSKMERQNYAESYTYYCAVRALMEREGFIFRNEFIDEEDKKNYENLYYEAYYRLQKTLFTNGYRIYTSIDLKKQEQLQNALDKELSGFTETNEEGIYKLQASAACIDNATGRIVAVVGGRSQEIEGYTLNRAYQSFRQPGSSIKPLIIYTPVFERGMYPDDIVLDEKFEGGPRNSGEVYSGEIPLSYAIAVSKNTVAWKLFEELTPQTGLSYLLKMGFNKIVATDYYPAVSLGGFTYGVSAVEMASAFAALENDGEFSVPTCIVKITDAQGREIAGGDTKKIKVYAANAARMMTYCLQEVMKSGTGRKLALSNQICAGKTGTTTDQKDGWFAGYTAYYTTAVWVGCDMPKAIEGLTGNSYPGKIWENYMNQIHEGLEAMEFSVYTDNRPKPETPEEREEGEERENKVEGTEDLEEGKEEIEGTKDLEERKEKIEGTEDLKGKMR